MQEEFTASYWNIKSTSPPPFTLRPTQGERHRRNVASQGGEW